MAQDAQELASVRKLQGLLQSRYGKGLELRYLVSTKEQNDDAHVDSGDLLVPIHMHGMFLGQARVPGVHDLPKTSIEAITEVVRLILEPALYRRFLETNPIESGQTKTFGEIQAVSDEKTKEDLEPKAVLLFSKNPARVERFAINLHETTERWAMLRYSDMGSFGEISDLKALGQATIFVEDLLQLSPQELEVLATYLHQCRPAKHPLVIIGSTRSLDEIQGSGHCPQDVMTELRRFTIDLDRWPQDDATMKRALSLCLQPGERPTLDF